MSTTLSNLTPRQADQYAITRHVYEAIGPDGRKREVLAEDYSEIPDRSESKEEARRAGARKLGSLAAETLVRYSHTKHGRDER